MHDTVKEAQLEIDSLPNVLTYETHIKTSDIRKLSAKLYGSQGDRTIGNIFSLCEEMLEEHNWAMGVIAFDWAYRKKNEYDDNTFQVFEKWLIKYVRDWGDCDDFCTHAFGELISKKTEYVQKVMEWTKREEYWMRRASAVILIPSILQNKYDETKPFAIADALMKDEHYLVLKGYGWMLKVFSLKEEDMVFSYLMQKRSQMPRVAFRYAMEKMNMDHRRILMCKE